MENNMNKIRRKHNGVIKFIQGKLNETLQTSKSAVFSVQELYEAVRSYIAKTEGKIVNYETIGRAFRLMRQYGLPNPDGGGVMIYNHNHQPLIIREMQGAECKLFRVEYAGNTQQQLIEKKKQEQGDLFDAVK